MVEGGSGFLGDLFQAPLRLQGARKFPAEDLDGSLPAFATMQRRGMFTQHADVKPVQLRLEGGSRFVAAQGVEGLCGQDAHAFGHGEVGFPACDLECGEEGIFAEELWGQEASAGAAVEVSSLLRDKRRLRRPKRAQRAGVLHATRTSP